MRGVEAVAGEEGGEGEKGEEDGCEGKEAGVGPTPLGGDSACGAGGEGGVGEGERVGLEVTAVHGAG